MSIQRCIFIAVIFLCALLSRPVSVMAGDSTTTKMFKRAFEYEKAGDYMRAEDLFRKLTKTSSVSAESYFGLGACFEAEGRFKESIANYRKAIALDPAQARYRKGLLHVQEAQARPLVEDAIQNLNRNQPSSIKRAISDLRRASSICDSPAMHLNLAQALLKAGRQDEAMIELQRANVDPDELRQKGIKWNQ